ncbi:olfactory receptor 4P4-like [Tachyglossus aculeatus]|uniref:olfactory receptor 4P4-like n=1 Tax=Tachyglossus aculeatus TaxID=9261 RepID=UPI0018F38C96|nr:olfactory receptor 4P4-like [Tachyglossus aculeatus]
MDLCYTSTVTPSLVKDLLSEKKPISFRDCMIQLFTMHLFGGVEILILVEMAYDCYVAICKPLHYVIVMNKQRCATMVAVCWGVAFLYSMVQWFLVIFLSFCGLNKIGHYFFDICPLLKLACSDTNVTGFLVFTNTGAIMMVTFAVLVFSYVIALANLRTHSLEQRDENSHEKSVVLEAAFGGKIRQIQVGGVARFRQPQGKKFDSQETKDDSRFRNSVFRKLPPSNVKVPSHFNIKKNPDCKYLESN